MKNKILIPLLILTALGTFFSFRYVTEDNSGEKNQLVISAVMKAIEAGHFAPRPIDDTLSYNVYHKILQNLDYEKKFFTQEDMAVLNKYEYKLDDQIESGSFDFFNALNDIFTKRIEQAEGYYKEILDQPFDFTKQEEITLSGDDLKYVTNDAELKERWRKYLKYRTLAKYVDLKETQEKAKESNDTAYVAKTDAELEKEARESIRKNQEFYFKRLNKIDENDRFSLYVNAITSVQDPHTDFFAPREKQMFDESMSGTFEGIGAQLSNEEGKIKIAAIIPGSPSWKQGDLKAGDEIIKVAEGAKEPVDIQGYDIEDAVKLIRGKKGTEVRLTVKRMNGTTKVIPIVRGEVLLEEVFAKSAIIKTENGPVGYIYLPEFYVNFKDASGRRSSEDVAIEVQKLKNAGVKGIILDLRNNGGGSLSDVVDITGLFIDEGPVVQVKASGGAAMTLKDQQKGALYDGPLAIMVNQNSASASEILAAAIQDYKRGVVVGATTFGKGTVQRVIPLDEFLPAATRLQRAANGDPSIGSIKLTVQKFYRVTGGSTQLKGVTPDITFPDAYELISMGERRDESALEWDEIPAARFSAASRPVKLSALAARSKERIAENESFDLIKESAKRLKAKEDDHTYPLNITAYKKEMAEAKEISDKLDALEEKYTKLAITNPKEDLPRINMDTTNVEKNKNWINNLQKDIYLAETVNIVNDMYKMDMNVNMGTGMK